MEFKKSTIIWTAGILGSLVLGGALFLLYKNRTKDTEFVPQQTEKPCPGETSEIVMMDSSLDGLVAKDQKLRLTDNWYACNPIVQDDLVLYRFSSEDDPVVRVVRAVPGDTFEVLRDKKVGAWNLKVNDTLLMDSASGDPYYFGANPRVALSLYEKANQGVLQQNDVILLSNVPPGSKDSGLFGVANTSDIVGKIEIISD